MLERVAGRCRQFGVRFVAADGAGAGVHLNRLLVNRRQVPLFGIVYTSGDSLPRQDGALWSWSVHRTGSIGKLFSRIRLRRISFPRVEDCGSYLDEFACQVAVYDDHHRTIKYTHPETQFDDALHATNYALLVAGLLLDNWRQYGDDEGP